MVEKKKVLLVEPFIHRKLVDFLQKEVEVHIAPDHSEQTLSQYLKGIHGLIVRSEKVPEGSLNAADSLEVIGRAGVGIDNIPIKLATKKGICVVNTPKANYIAVAEHTVGLMIALAKNITVADREIRRGRWRVRDRLVNIELEGKKLGIIGLGKIGTEVAQKCIHAFRMEVRAYDPYVSPEKAQKIGVQLVEDLIQLIKYADFVSIHAPLTPETHHLLGEKELSQMKPNAYLINTARGAIVDESALLRALENKKIGGAALDVFTNEPLPEDSPLVKLDNIILTPHLSPLAEETKVRMARDVAKGVLAVLKGQRPQYLVNPEVWKWKGSQ